MPGLTPTSAAMRASGFFFDDGKSNEHAATVIDRETGLPELIDACQAAAMWIGIQPGDASGNRIWQALHNALAIAREGRK